MLHVVLRRHTLGRDLQQYAVSMQARRHRRNQVSRQDNDMSPSRISARGTQQMTSNHTDAGHGAGSQGIIALGIVQHPHDKKDPAVVVTIHSGTSLRSGESSSQIGSAAHIDSTDETQWTSRRTSASMSDDRGSSVDGEADGTTSVDIKV